ncbi:hypothetical protein [Bradyrhizobium neotropicale]|uniref:hypothetical protein n=1 Tax=Bradyrhizobium neotropicale TaxID=1497615 RepID=UPI001AD7CD6B|nr:hypothetical protein [Bradyrhizobium neotropicale]MBO4227525.1 hypothetical protein [Bradyrhizobium neotropicale]
MLKQQRTEQPAQADFEQHLHDAQQGRPEHPQPEEVPEPGLDSLWMSSSGRMIFMPHIIARDEEDLISAGAEAVLARGMKPRTIKDYRSGLRALAAARQPDGLGLAGLSDETLRKPAPEKPRRKKRIGYPPEVP